VDHLSSLQHIETNITTDNGDRMSVYPPLKDTEKRNSAVLGKMEKQIVTG
jgi:hypothetical protein